MCSRGTLGAGADAGGRWITGSTRAGLRPNADAGGGQSLERLALSSDRRQQRWSRALCHARIRAGSRLRLCGPIEPGRGGRLALDVADRVRALERLLQCWRVHDDWMYSSTPQLPVMSVLQIRAPSGDLDLLWLPRRRGAAPRAATAARGPTSSSRLGVSATTARRAVAPVAAHMGDLSSPTLALDSGHGSRAVPARCSHEVIVASTAARCSQTGPVSPLGAGGFLRGSRSRAQWLGSGYPSRTARWGAVCRSSRGVPPAPSAFMSLPYRLGSHQTRAAGLHVVLHNRKRQTIRRAPVGGHGRRGVWFLGAMSRHFLP